MRFETILRNKPRRCHPLYLFLLLVACNQPAPDIRPTAVSQASPTVILTITTVPATATPPATTSPTPLSITPLPDVQTTLTITGSVQGDRLTYLPAELPPAGSRLETIRGVVVGWNPAEITIRTPEGTTYLVNLINYYHFKGLPIALQREPLLPPLPQLIESVEPITVLGYPGYDGSEARVYPLWIGWSDVNGMTPFAYHTFFDMSHFELEPLLLGLYPDGAGLYLWGTWAEIRPYLLHPDNLDLADEQNLLAHGLLQTAVPPRLTLTQLYTYDGNCHDAEPRRQCHFYRPLLGEQ
jgi:hypothetical protein